MPALQGARGMTSRRQSGPPTRASKRHQGPEGGHTPLGTHLHIPGVAARGCGRTLAREAHPCSEAMATQVVVPSGPPVEASSYVRGHPFEDTMCSKAPHSKQRRLRSDWPGREPGPTPLGNDGWPAARAARAGVSPSWRQPFDTSSRLSPPGWVGKLQGSSSRREQRWAGLAADYRGGRAPSRAKVVGIFPQLRLPAVAGCRSSPTAARRVAEWQPPILPGLAGTAPRRRSATPHHPPHPRTGCPMTCP